MFTRLLALAITSSLLFTAASALAEGESRTAGRQAGEPVREAPQKPAQSDEPVKSKKAAAKSQPKELTPEDLVDVSNDPPEIARIKKRRAKLAAQAAQASGEAAPGQPVKRAARQPQKPAPSVKETAAETKKPAIRPEDRIKEKPRQLPAERAEDALIRKAALPESTGKTLRADYVDLESRGLYYSPQDGSLGRDLWTKTHRSALVELLPALRQPRNSPIVQAMTAGLLLSQADAGLIENDIAPQAGHDLLTMRLMKLMELGMGEQALKLYSDLGQDPYHPNLAQAGIMALLFSGEKSLACLEYKTLEDREFSGEFWTDISYYCHYVLEDRKPGDSQLESIHSPAIRKIVSGGRFTIDYEARKIAEVPLVDRAILTAENAINFGGFGLDGVRRIAPAHLGMALKKPNLSRQDQFLIQMKMVERGLKSAAEWERAYAGFKFNGPADEQKIITIESLPGWQQLPALYQNAKTAEKGPAQKAFALQALNYTSTYGPAAAYPFADMLAAISPADLSTGELTRIARILHGADKDIPAGWFDTLAKRKPYGEKDTALYVLAYVAKAYQRPSPQDRELVKQAVSSLKEGRMKENFTIIIENVDNTSAAHHNASKVYDKDLDLTQDGNYVMPFKRVWDRLNASSQNQSIGETVLLSSLLLNDKPVTDMYSGVLGDVLKSLRAVGLTRFSKSMAQEALLEIL